MKLVVDASVAVKWILRDQPGELHVDRAFALLGAIARRSVSATEPVHWVAEVAGVVARLKPDRAAATIALLTHARFSIVSSRVVYRRAADIAAALNHHLFDTLYHAVALEERATLVRADEVYFDKAKGLGGIVALADFSDPSARWTSRRHGPAWWYANCLLSCYCWVHFNDRATPHGYDELFHSRRRAG